MLPTRWEGLLYVSANSKVRSYLESGAYTPASGMTSRTRRASKLAYVRAKLQATTGREPTDAEVISAWNAEAHERYADAVRQGMVASEADLAPVTSRNIDDTVLPVVDLRDDFVLHPNEPAGFVASVTRACEQVSQQAREVAEEATRSGSRVPAGTGKTCASVRSRCSGWGRRCRRSRSSVTPLRSPRTWASATRWRGAG